MPLQKLKNPLPLICSRREALEGKPNLAEKANKQLNIERKIIMEFAIDGDFENIEPAKIAETGTYKLCVTRTEVKQNRAEDGNNLEIDLMVIEDPSCEGITFTMYCALPKPGDTDKKTKRGQTYKDFKLDMLKQKVEALGGSCAGSGVVVPEDALVKATVEKRTSNENRPFNVLIEDTISPLDGGKLELS